MSSLGTQIAQSLPIFSLIVLGYVLATFAPWAREAGSALSTFVFNVSLPALLFSITSTPSRSTPSWKVVGAYFGGCFVIFAVSRLVARFATGLDGVDGSLFAVGGIFSNNVLLGIPLAQAFLGPAALPVVAMVLIFNAAVLWTLATASIEQARGGALTAKSLLRTAVTVTVTPLVLAIVLGTCLRLVGLRVPSVVADPIHSLGQSATPLALVVLGIGLQRYGLREGWKISIGITAIKLVLHPLAVWLLALALGLSTIETLAVVLMASIATGANVYLMAEKFGTMQGPVASAIVVSTTLSVVTTPIWLRLAGQ
ncbi:AEC family transporter [Cryptosporangium sp. NPDC048952]|uniref:AEC family transporter n=1 Tax=Cryptosporangium sp. NPDC048952 TaxID=3363961 RepID=UPI003720870A